MAIKVTRAVWDALQREFSRALPKECCGILLGKDGQLTDLVMAANVHPTPTTRFEIDPQVLVDTHRAARNGGARVLGYYHSHPEGPSEPSRTDRAMAAGDGMVWAIVTAGDVTFWRDDGTGFAPLSYEVGND